MRLVCTRLRCGIEGISLIEAFACGLVPIISDSKQSAAAQFALGPQNLFKAGSPESLAEKIDYWLDHPEQLKKLKRNMLN